MKINMGRAFALIVAATLIPACEEGNDGAMGPQGPVGNAILGYSSTDDTGDSTTSATYVDLGGPSVTFTLPNPADVFVDYGSTIAPDAAVGGISSISIDGAAPADADRIVFLTGSASSSASVSRVLRYSLSAGTHTLTMQYRVGFAGGTAGFASRWLRVIQG